MKKRPLAAREVHDGRGKAQTDGISADNADEILGGSEPFPHCLQPCKGAGGVPGNRPEQGCARVVLVREGWNPGRLPGSPRYVKALASTYMKKKDFESAISMYKQLVGQERSMENYGELGMACFKAGKHNEAIEAFKNAAEKGELTARFLNGLGQTYLSLEKDEMALSCFEDVLKKDPDNLEGRLQVGIIEYRRKNWAQSEKYLRGVLALNAADVDARYYVAMIEVQKSRYDVALKQFQELLTIVTKDARVYYGIGLTYARRKDSNKAIESFVKAIELNGAMLDARWELGKIYEAVNSKEMAYREFKAILTTDPNHPLKQQIEEKMKRLRDDGVLDNDVRKY